MAARLAYTNLLTVSGVVITSSSEATGYVDDNLASPARWKKWRSATDVVDQWVKFDLGSNKSLTVLAAISARVHTGGTLRAQAHATDTWGAPTVNELLTIPSPDYTGVVAAWIAAQSLRWVRFYFTNTGAVNEFVELGVAFVGTYLQPSISIAPGLGVRRVDPSEQRRAIGGQRSTVVRSKFHEVSGLFRLQSASARDDLRTAFDTNGASIPAVFAPTPGTAGLTFYGTLVPDLAATHHDTSADLWSVPFGFVEDVA